MIASSLWSTKLATFWDLQEARRKRKDSPGVQESRGRSPSSHAELQSSVLSKCQAYCNISHYHQPSVVFNTIPVSAFSLFLSSFFKLLLLFLSFIEIL